MTKKKRVLGGAVVMLSLLLVPLTVFAAGEAAEYTSPMYATFWALIPPVIAITLALITKEVYSSLFVGILVGGLFYANFNPELTLNHILVDGMIGVLSDSGNVGILLFLVILGTIVCLMNKAGGSAAFGEFAAKRIKTKAGAQLATILLGGLIFIDDYFNCLTVGSVMRPVTDKHKVSREKLAYLIDATAAPICIIAPISSWAAAVTGFVDGEDGLALFVKAIPYNFYALLTLFMLIAAVLMKTEFGPMRTCELAAQKAKKIDITQSENNKKGKVVDLVFPIVVLIVSCVIGMVYTGGFFEGVGFRQAFAESDASVGLVLGSFAALILTIIFYLVRRILTMKECMECLPEGFKAMVPAILILTFAWTLKAMTDSLGAGAYVEALMKGSAESLMSFLPAVIFVVAGLLAFATGTSWGTFGILIPIVVEVFRATDNTLMIISISACMAGAVCGDHCSPISDTTIMASAGAQCDHVKHVSTQLPYAIFVAVISFIVYMIAGFTKSAWTSLPIGMLLVLLGLMLMKHLNTAKE